MTTAHSIEPGAFLADQLAAASPDLFPSMMAAFIQSVLSAEVDAQIDGAGYGQKSPDRTNSRNGYRHRELDTRAGTIDVAVPKLRAGTYFLEWLLERLNGPRRH